MKPKPTHGGKRPGSGRKPTGKPPAVTRSVSMPEVAWNVLDAARGEQSRGGFIAKKLNLKQP